MQFLHIPNSDKPVAYFNLDMIISVGYRVKSKTATQFRIWATNVLKNHLVKGYTINEKRLRQEVEHYKELRNTIAIIGDVLERQSLGADQTGGLLKVITDFAYALDILDAYDYQRLEVSGLSRKKGKPISYKEARGIIETLREQYKATELFGVNTVKETVQKNRPAHLAAHIFVFPHLFNFTAADFQ